MNSHSFPIVLLCPFRTESRNFSCWWHQHFGSIWRSSSRRSNVWSLVVKSRSTTVVAKRRTTDLCSTGRKHVATCAARSWLVLWRESCCRVELCSRLLSHNLQRHGAAGGWHLIRSLLRPLIEWRGLTGFTTARLWTYSVLLTIWTEWTTVLQLSSWTNLLSWTCKNRNLSFQRLNLLQHDLAPTREERCNLTIYYSSFGTTTHCINCCLPLAIYFEVPQCCNDEMKRKEPDDSLIVGFDPIPKAPKVNACVM